MFGLVRRGLGDHFAVKVVLNFAVQDFDSLVVLTVNCSDQLSHQYFV